MSEKGQFFRRISILERLPLQGRGKVTVQELRDHLRSMGEETTVRTVQRDLVWLASAFPITCDEGHPPGWYWHRDTAGLQAPRVDSLMAMTLLLSHEVLRPLLPSGLLRNWEHYREAAERSLAHSPLADWPRRVVVVPSGIQAASTLPEPQLLQLLEAIEQNHRVWLRYQAPGQKAKEHTLSVWGLVLQDGILYCVCATSEGNPLLFAGQRIQSLRLLDEPALPMPAIFCLKDFARAALRFSQPGQAILLRLQVHCGLIHLFEERPIGTKQQILKRGRIWCTLEAEVEASPALEWWILSFGDKMKVLEPRSLRLRLKETTASMARLYG
ncbi:WYL domain-containing protein [Acidithiobacillus sp. CV18-2]|uniref:WYL domain-containing protein n=1 Tax=Igneacidithiobacillus copahuensis TaxID=2724909 RepID=A0AAE3CL60_9PROT|nr:WYL domain-containing protein [Igneacidithiobacillus copahuensis]MBU2754168.1 WYL domain-containing protein [Acidithiobacillus sp. CV18-3]MBU2758475.1 WYL domain-containing protein [Acidithiobacillus sp. BN09-2]MBU2776748.1 WYL domain-containing protein [Acidithiobacillus sp. CV18-2]MBU2797072.1 WYL domain-containing protein [Acidithiobacillus sp. VAN18-2]MBU2798479.1 WYL domain-containing protein [Acidithiobacillus sp. VAN18-4]UTV80142.1 WYL domain-containing protein [Acidithiobacillus sp